MARVSCFHPAPWDPKYNFGTPVFVVTVDHEHVARACAAIRQRRQREQQILVDGKWESVC